jgi:hypothetical protein
MITGHKKVSYSFVSSFQKHFFMNPIYIRKVSLLIIFSTAFFGFTVTPEDQVTEDLKHANPRIHWPSGFSPKTADLYAHNEIMIDAPVDVVFRHIQEAEKWPGWYSNSQHVVIHGNDKLLKKDTEWDWDTFGVHIKSHINEFVVNSRIGWFGNGTGMHAYHTWYLRPMGENRTFVVMEECVYGAGAKDLRQKDPAVMHRGHELWDTTLKALSEAYGHS